MNKNHFVFFILLFCCGNFLWAAPKKEMLDKYQKELTKEIPFKFTKKPLMEILEHIKKKSEFTIIIDEQSIIEETPLIPSKNNATKSVGKSIKSNKDEPGSVDYSLYQFPELTLNFDSITILDALYWLEELTYLDFEISDKGVFISTKEALIKPLVVLKMYDFSTVFFRPDDFYANSIIKVDFEQTGFSRNDSGDSEASTETAADVIKLLKENIKDGNWDLKATSISSNDYVLKVINTPEIHQKVASLIEKIQNKKQKQIVIDFKLLQTPMDALDKINVDNSSSIFLSNAEYKKLILTELSAKKDIVEIHSSKLVCFNDQYVFTFCGYSQNYLANFDILDGIPNPRMRVDFFKGFNFQIRPVVSFDNSHINLDIISDQILNTEVLKHEIMTQSEKNGGLGVHIRGDLDGNGKSAKNEKEESIDIQGKVDSKGELVVHHKSPAKTGEVNKLQITSLNFLQSLIIQNGGAVIMKRSSGKLKDNKSYYFVIQAQTIELKD